MADKGFSAPVLWNFIQFQAGWFALVLGAAHGRPLWGVIVVAVLTAIHLLWFARKNEWQFLALVAALGWLWESLVHALGLLSYPDYPVEALVAPLWMGALWLNFASAIYHSLAWLQGQLFVAGLLGAAGGPLAFLAGEKLGAVTFGHEIWTTLFLVVAWGLLTPLIFKLAERIAGDKQAVIGAVLESR